MSDFVVERIFPSHEGIPNQTVGNRWTERNHRNLFKNLGHNNLIDPGNGIIQINVPAGRIVVDEPSALILDGYYITAGAGGATGTFDTDANTNWRIWFKYTTDRGGNFSGIEFEFRTDNLIPDRAMLLYQGRTGSGGSVDFVYERFLNNGVMVGEYDSSGSGANDVVLGFKPTMLAVKAGTSFTADCLLIGEAHGIAFEEKEIGGTLSGTQPIVTLQDYGFSVGAGEDMDVASGRFIAWV